MFQKNLQHAEFGSGQRHHHAFGIEQMARIQIQRPAGELHLLRRSDGGHVRRQSLGSPQHAADARKQFARFERLGQIVVRAHFEPKDTVQRRAARGQHDDRNRGLRAQIAAQRQTVFARQSEVQHDQIDIRLGQHLAHLDAVAGGQCAEAVGVEILGQESPDVAVVVDHQDMCRVFHGAIMTNRPQNGEPGLYSDVTKDPRAT